ncbi:MAG TPA: right-handed parallel beta-helix repeat-containing protein, partial [Phycisphaerae bacterium]|nr:right-handed parallel beta-helix repeat-containing protein [Phycisphaerae bacterium]HQL75832.1 right-handed parallel beta-helix repeat-containing protein [Phycisphaerae bacterium]
MLSTSLFVEQLTPTGGAGHPFDQMELQFSEAVRDGTFTLADVTLTGPIGEIAPSALNKLAADRYELVVTGLTGLNTYTLEVGPDILADATGDQMDQDRDGTPGQAGDGYTAALFANGATIADGDGTYDDGSLVIYGNTVTVNGAHTFDVVDVAGGATVNANGDTLGVYNLSLTGASTVNLAGGSTTTAQEAIVLTGNSTLVCRSIDNTAEVGGEWIGEGVTINAANLTVEAGSVITADGQGYVTFCGPGGGGYGGGGSYGGAGSGSAAGPTYGSNTFPVDLGSGGGRGNSISWSYGGGAIRLDVTGTMTLDGEVSADAQTGGPYADGASGGSIFVTAATLVGSGRFTADGKSGYSSAHGGGGRIAVYYNTDGGFTGFSTSTASAGGTGAGHGTTAFFDRSVPDYLMDVYQHYEVAQHTEISLGSLVLHDATFWISGGTTVDVAGDLHVLGSSTVICRSIDNTAEVGGEWIGEGVTINAANLTVEAGSVITADGQGYATTAGPGGSAAGSNAAGGSHGGAGSGPAGPTYGSAAVPLDLGSGGGFGNAGSWSYGGGAIRLNVANALTLDGEITADGQSGGNYDRGAAGGSVLVNTGTLAGSGQITADGNDGWTADGGGGRVAVYHRVGMSLPVPNLTAAGGPMAGVGTVTITDAPVFFWVGPGDALLHDTETLAWDAVGVNWAATAVDVTAYGSRIDIGTGLPAQGTIDWDTTTASDGQYELRSTYLDPSSMILGRAAMTVLINNEATWHSGRIQADETWAAGEVHVVEGDVQVAAGARITVEPGAIVKFANSVGITVEDGGFLDALATEASPIVFTALADDTAGGDTNWDEDGSAPMPGDWSGVGILGSGQFNTTEHTQLRYLTTTHSGVLPGSQAWGGSTLHHVTANVTVPNGVTLTINPGAIVKFDADCGITVQTGGTLLAQGSVVQPIAFTSIRDDSVGGDSNGDGNATAPAPGDWTWLFMDGGQATIDHALLSYGAGPTGIGDGSHIGVVRTQGGAVVTLANSVIRDPFWGGVTAWGGGDVTVSNCLITDAARAVTADGGTVRLINCTLDENQVGLWPHGGALTMTNSIISNSGTAGVPNGATSVQYSNIWSPTGDSYQPGVNGNVSVDPQYRGPVRGDYRLGYVSPMIDSADGTVAPATDHMGAPRYDDPRTPNTGVADGGGEFPDMGAFEFVETAESNIDLAASSVSGPPTAVAGQSVTVAWTVVNVGTEPVVGPWHDQVLMDGQLAAEVVTGTGVVLGVGESIDVSADVRVPGAVVGEHHWSVAVNARSDVFEGQNRTNNYLMSLAPFELDVLELVVDGPALDGTFTYVGQSDWFKFVPVAGQDIRLSLDLAGATGGVNLYIGEGYMPTAQHYDFCQDQWNSPSVTALAPQTDAQTYYVLAVPVSLSGPTDFTLWAHALGFQLDSVSPDVINNSGEVTLTLTGGQLAADMTYQLIDSAGNAYKAAPVDVANSSLVYATFDLPNVPTGEFSVRVTAEPPAAQQPSRDAPEGSVAAATSALQAAQTVEKKGGTIVNGNPGRLVLVGSAKTKVVRCLAPYKIGFKLVNNGGSNVMIDSVSLTGTGSLFGSPNAEDVLQAYIGLVITPHTPDQLTDPLIIVDLFALGYPHGTTNVESWQFTVRYKVRESGVVVLKEVSSFVVTETVVQSGDPNDMKSSGFGPEGWVPSQAPITNTIRFENMPTASAPAARVVVTSQLASDFDWSTFQFTDIRFNTAIIDVPPGLQGYTTQVYVQADPNPVNVTAALNPATGVVTWIMESIDPVTGQLVTDPFAGFLPPDDADYNGCGSLSYSVQPKAGLATGTQITGQASIVFDVNAPMETNIVLNTIDAGGPSSQVDPLPATAPGASFDVSWTGADDAGGSGVASYDIYVSDDGGVFQLWLDDTPDTSAQYTGEGGHTYSFYSVATDHVGHRETAPATADATTTVPPGVEVTIGTGQAPALMFTDADGTKVTVRLIGGTATVVLAGTSLAVAQSVRGATVTGAAVGGGQDVKIADIQLLTGGATAMLMI